MVANIEFEKQTQALSVHIQNWKGKLEMAKVQMSKPTTTTNHHFSKGST
jgi:hypothetical protein